MKSEAQEHGVLKGILAAARADVRRRAGERAAWEARAYASPQPPAFARALRGASVGVIAEFKRRSPSAGTIRETARASLVASLYADAGAAAVSVLTEGPHFGGSLADLEDVARTVAVPALRKDFIVDPLQVFEARAAGAAAVLLIVRALDLETLASLSRLAHGLGLATLVEVHREDELDAALAVSPSAVGVNARDLDTLAMDHALVERLLPRVPAEVIAVAESGLASRADVERVAAAGADAVLIGTSVLGAKEPGAAVRALTGVPRKGRR